MYRQSIVIILLLILAMAGWNLHIWLEVDKWSLENIRKQVEGVISRNDKRYIQLAVDTTEAKVKLDELNKKMKETMKTGTKEDVKKIIIETAEAESKLKNLQNELKNLDNRLDWNKRSWWSLTGVVKGFFALAIVQQIISFTKNVFNLTSQLQQLRNGFTTLTGSAEKAAKLMADIDAFARKTPFSKMEVAFNAQKLMWYGFAAEQVLPVLQSIGNAVSAMGGNADTLNGVVLAIGQIYTKWRVMSQEMLQLSERGIPAWEMLAKWLWKTMAETQKMVENGAVSAWEWLDIILWWFQEKYNWSLDKQSKTLQGKWSNLMDGISQSVAKFWDGISSSFGKAIDSIGAIFSGLSPVVFSILSDILATIESAFSTTMWYIYSLSGVTQEEVKKQWWFWHLLWITLLALWVGIKVLVLTTLIDIWKAITVSGKNFLTFFSNLWGAIFDILSWSFWAVNIMFKNLVYNAKWWIPWIGDAFVWMANSALDAVEWLINWSLNAFNKFTNFIADKTGADFLRTNFDAVSLNGYKMAKLAWQNMARGITDGIWNLNIWSLTQWLEKYNFEFNNLWTNIRAVAEKDGLIWMINWTWKWKEYDLNTLDWMGKRINDIKKEMQGLNVQSKEYNDLQKELIGLQDKQKKAFWFDKLKPSSPMGSWETKKNKEETEKLQYATMKLKDAYGLLDKELSDLEKTQEKLGKAQKSWAELVEKTNKKIISDTLEMKKAYDDVIESINKAANKDKDEAVADRYKDITDQISDAEKKISDAQAEYDATMSEIASDAQKNINTWEFADDTSKKRADAQAKLDKTKQENQAILDELRAIQNKMSTDGTISADAKAWLDVRAGMTDVGRDQYDFQAKLDQMKAETDAKIAEETRLYNEKKTQQENLEKITAMFMKTQELSQSQLIAFKKMLDEKYQWEKEQKLIEELFKERQQLEDAEREEVVSLRRVHNLKLELLEQYRTMESTMIAQWTAEYQSLIDKINEAISRAEALKSVNTTASGGKWFAEGGYTGDGNKYDVAWVVHKGEYVIPKTVLEKIQSSMPNFIPNLEVMRQGGTTHIDQSRPFTISWPITVQTPFDLEREFSRMAWRNNF